MSYVSSNNYIIVTNAASGSSKLSDKKSTIENIYAQLTQSKSDSLKSDSLKSDFLSSVIAREESNEASFLQRMNNKLSDLGLNVKDGNVMKGWKEFILSLQGNISDIIAQGKAEISELNKDINEGEKQITQECEKKDKIISEVREKIYDELMSLKKFSSIDYELGEPVVKKNQLGTIVKRMIKNKETTKQGDFVSLPEYEKTLYVLNNGKTDYAKNISGAEVYMTELTEEEKKEIGELEDTIEKIEESMRKKINGNKSIVHYLRIIKIGKIGRGNRDRKSGIDELYEIAASIENKDINGFLESLLQKGLLGEKEERYIRQAIKAAKGLLKKTNRLKELQERAKAKNADIIEINSGRIIEECKEECISFGSMPGKHKTKSDIVIHTIKLEVKKEFKELKEFGRVFNEALQASRPSGNEVFSLEEETKAYISGLEEIRKKIKEELGENSEFDFDDFLKSYLGIDISTKAYDFFIERNKSEISQIHGGSLGEGGKIQAVAGNLSYASGGQLSPETIAIFLLNSIPQAILGQKNEGDEVLAKHIVAFALMSMFSSGGLIAESILQEGASSPNIIHLFDFKTFYVPLSYTLKQLNKQFNDTSIDSLNLPIVSSLYVSPNIDTEILNTDYKNGNSENIISKLYQTATAELKIQFNINAYINSMLNS